MLTNQIMHLALPVYVSPRNRCLGSMSVIERGRHRYPRLKREEGMHINNVCTDHDELSS